ncbi:MAG: Reverse transcriptase (RNA-dependent DNA polymerase) [Candidatus Adlerbacteria bacterium GW2011_GWA1_54_10]|uniref:Reverse transcriptase (RNA-dependent DNA polymerase) n=1 Tax=Candidatus Adlerbacteria bacterium GW2011_GWA1_54_10 TaxID=1618605 RepID=A0A0G1XW98_9BACT|nr:MAG: Reverse transcriptase (RNA-dependent DNA polymerase) [Candidatus Adlerbacteria bacterium GW2011_GWA1_54_10]
MNEFDQFVKHTLKTKHYIRYADDFVLFSHNKTESEKRLRYIVVFLRDELKLELHPNKVSITTVASGVDFLVLLALISSAGCTFPIIGCCAPVLSGVCYGGRESKRAMKIPNSHI